MGLMQWDNYLRFGLQIGYRIRRPGQQRPGDGCRCEERVSNSVAIFSRFILTGIHDRVLFFD